MKKSKHNTNLPPVQPGGPVTTAHTGAKCKVCGSPMYGIYRGGRLEVTGCPNEDMPDHWDYHPDKMGSKRK